MHVCLAVSGSVVNSRSEVQFELSIGSTVGAEKYSTRSVRPCKAKESFVLCELPPLVAGELRFQGAVAENAGCCVGSPDQTGARERRPTTRSPSGNSRSESRSVAGTSRNRGRRLVVKS